MSSLLDDLRDEQTAHLLATGNLKREKTPPIFVPVWASCGYVARVSRFSCACGKLSWSPVLVCHREKSLTGEIRDTALGRGFQIPLGNSYPIEVTETPTKLCTYCLPRHGFGPSVTYPSPTA